MIFAVSMSIADLLASYSSDVWYMHMPSVAPCLPHLHRGSQRGKSCVVPNYSTLLFVYRFPLFSPVLLLLLDL